MTSNARRSLPILLTVFAAAPGCAAAGPMCKQADVVDFAAREIQKQAAYVRVER
ncbi:MAG: hypothetical protein JOZ42_12925, partial [Acetobacteraceae bacterium]|nr:hypothetical protein [Acetobacteraceae bacterium]